MKRYHIYTLLLTVAALFFVTAAGAKGNTYKGNIRFSDPKMSREGNMFVINVGVDMSSVKMKNQQMITLTPMLTSKESGGMNTSVFAPIVVSGKTRHKAVEREILFGHYNFEYEPSEMIKRRNNKRQVIPVTLSTPYEEWMGRAELVFLEEISGCANCQVTYNEYAVRATAPKQVCPKFMLSIIAPPVEEVKARSEKYSASINYEVGKSNIQRNYKNNAMVLDEVDRIINGLRYDLNLRLTELTVVGYASPEGGTTTNLNLSRNRTQSFVDYLHRTHGIPQGMINAQWKGEDWDGLRKAVEESSLPEKRQVINIIDSYPDPAKRKSALQSLNGGETYRYLLNVYYPPLRRNDYTISYIARAFNVEEAKVLIHTKPQQLSLNEMYLVAQTYPVGSNEYKEVFDIAARLFPQDPIANINAAAIEIEHGAMDLGIRRLGGINAPEAYNNLGVAYAKKGDYQTAEQYFRRAADSGNMTARDNLQELMKVIGR